jgi:hypothetical protein
MARAVAAVRHKSSFMQNRYSESPGYRCDICRRQVDHEIADRARRGWQPLVVCEDCVREAQTGGRSERLAA